MRQVSRVPSIEATENDGQRCPVPTRPVRTPRINGQRIKFRDLAKFTWPEKTESHLAHITGYDARTCRRWLGEHTEPPAEAFALVMFEIMRLFTQR